VIVAIEADSRIGSSCRVHFLSVLLADSLPPALSDECKEEQLLGRWGLLHSETGKSWTMSWEGV